MKREKKKIKNTIKKRQRKVKKSLGQKWNEWKSKKKKKIAEAKQTKIECSVLLLILIKVWKKKN